MNAIKIQCPACDKESALPKINGTWDRKTVQCPKCNAQFIIALSKEVEEVWVQEGDKPIAVSKAILEALAALEIPIEAKPKTAPDILQGAAETYRERNKLYGDSYKSFGVMMSALFPKGLHINAEDVQQFNTLGVLTMIVSKVTRYAANLNTGGHQDSAHDLMVYAAMLEEITNEKK